MKNQWLKIGFDYIVAFVLLVMLIFPLVIIWVWVSIETRQNGIFAHQRIGKYGKPFYLYKIRTLKGEYTNPITTETTHQFTRTGKWLSKYKLDEVPQLWNILNGTMSFVGPRPDVAGYADELQGEDRCILQVKPGITGPAQLKYKNESEILNQVPNPKQYNDEVLWKDKVRINVEYAKNWSFTNDIKILWQTLVGE